MTPTTRTFARPGVRGGAGGCNELILLRQPFACQSTPISLDVQDVAVDRRPESKDEPPSGRREDEADAAALHSEQRPDHTSRVVEFAMELPKIVKRFNQERGTNLLVDVGINAGPVVGGIVGRDKFIFQGVYEKARMRPASGSKWWQIVWPTTSQVAHQNKTRYRHPPYTPDLADRPRLTRVPLPPRRVYRTPMG